MIDQDRTAFFELIAEVYAFYGKDFSVFSGNVWWSAMEAYDFAAVSEALSRHAANPDNGQFMPKPADVIRMLEGSTQDSALAAWAKVDAAVRVVGPHRSVCFDDAVIHRVVYEMGGWVLIGGKDDKEWPFVRNEFVTRYRGYRGRRQLPDYPPVMIGIAEASNSKEGFATDEPMLLGQPQAAQRVRLGGSATPLLGIQRADLAAGAATLQLVDGREVA